MLTDVMTRSLGRAAGPQGVCPETPENVAKLALKMATHFHRIKSELGDLVGWAQAMGCPVISAPYDHCAKLLTPDV